MNSMQEMQHDNAIHRLKSDSTATELELMEKELDNLVVRVRSMREKLKSTEL